MLGRSYRHEQVLIALLGLLLVSYHPEGTAMGRSLGGDALIVISTVFAAGYVVFSSKSAEKFPAAVLAGGQQLLGLMCALVVFTCVRNLGLMDQALTDLSWGLLVYAALSGVVQYALAFWLYLIGLQYLSAGAAGLWLTLVPVFGVLGSYVWLGEIPTAFMLLGLVLIIGAVTMGRLEK